jgi:hypothetical protein
MEIELWPRNPLTVRERSILATTAFLAFSIWGVQPLFANWGGEAGGSVATGTFKPNGTGQVEMLKEDLRIRLYRDRAKVEVDYVLRNTGDAIDVKAGYPSLGVKIEDEAHREIEGYSLFADGRSVPFRREEGNSAPFTSLYGKDFLDNVTNGNDVPGIMLLEWLVSTVHFGKGESKRISIEYESLYAYSDGGVSEDSDYLDDRFVYLLSTGAAWKGPIREGRITIQAVTVDAAKIIVSPKGRFRQTKEGLVWEFHDLKPTTADNIVVNLNDHFSTIADSENRSAKSTSDVNWYSFEVGKYYFNSHDFSVRGAERTDGFLTTDPRINPEAVWRSVHSPGLGEAVSIEITSPMHVDQIGIMPGCGKDKQEWFSHSRIKNLEVTVNGKYTVTYTLPDEYISFAPDSWKGYELVNLPAYPGNAHEIQVTIQSVYLGSRDQVTCISEVLLRQLLKIKPTVRGVNGKELP